MHIVTFNVLLLQILMEFERLTETEIKGNMSRGLDKYGTTILQIRPQKHTTVWEEVTAAVANAATEETKKRK